MQKQKNFALALILLGGLFLIGCVTNTQPTGVTPVPTLLSPGAVTLAPFNPTALPVAGGAPGSAGSGTPAAGGGVVPGGQSGQPQQGIAAVGAALFMQKCSPCHGNEGQGDIGPALRNNNFIQSGDTPVFQTISQGRLTAGMPAWYYDNGGPLSSGQIYDVIAYLKTLQNVPNIPKNTPMPPQPTSAPTPFGASTPIPAAPSNPGGPGNAVNLQGNAQQGVALFGANCAACHGPEGLQGIPNPGSDDGSVPDLNPIDETIASKDLQAFKQHVDVFIQHGSIPSGPSPQIVMPSFGASNLLTQQQIADIIAYVISLNQPK